MSSLIHQVIRSAYLSRELCVAVMPRGAGHALRRPGRLVTPVPPPISEPNLLRSRLNTRVVRGIW